MANPLLGLSPESVAHADAAAGLMLYRLLEALRSHGYSGGGGDPGGPPTEVQCRHGDANFRVIRNLLIKGLKQASALIAGRSLIPGCEKCFPRPVKENEEPALWPVLPLRGGSPVSDDLPSHLPRASPEPAIVNFPRAAFNKVCSLRRRHYGLAGESSEALNLVRDCAARR